MSLRRLATAGVLLGCLVLGLAALPGAAGAADSTAGTALKSSGNEACLACHGQKGENGFIDVDGERVSIFIDVGGERKSIYVDPATHASSRHGKLACVSCHLGFNEGMHSETVTSGWLRRTKLDVCGDCHADEALMYEGSFHGALTLTRQDTRAPLCADCHDAHNIVSPGTPAFRESVAQLCTRCHGGREATYLDSYHGKAFALGREGAAVCTDCHLGHRIVPGSNASSSVSKRNLAETCGRCHPGANNNFAGFQVHVNPQDPRSSWLIFLFWAAYVALIAVVFTFAAVHTSLYVYRGFREGMYAQRVRTPRDRRGQTRVEYHRFNVFHRLMHFLVIVSFTTLVFTGMPLKYKDAAWAQWFMDLFGGVTAAGVYHRIAAIVTVFYWTAEVIYVIVVLLRSRGKELRGPNSLVPRMKDLHDMVGMFGWFVGRGPKPQFDRFTYWEKFDYLSLFAGTVIIGATGFMMWFPLETTQHLPGVVLNIALVIHSNEALLAMGVIFIFVHFFSAHLRPESFPIDKVMFTGTLPVHHYRDDRPLEYARRVEEGTLDEVLVEKTVTWGTLFGDSIWWVITGAAGVGAVLMTAFVVWSVVR
ncbi:MAG: cytochrome c3 family protein [Thermoleophilia bacterium]